MKKLQKLAEQMAAYSQEPVDYGQLTLAEVQKLAEQGDPEAQVRLGFMYLYGQGVPQDGAEGEGVPQDPAEAMRWYRMAAEQGHVVGQYQLGLNYRGVEGIPQDYTESVKWLRAAAEQGHVLSMVWLGASYEKSVGVPQDYVQAHKWFNLATVSEAASKSSRERGVTVRDDLAERMTREQIAEAQRLATEWEPKTWEVIRKELKIE